MKKISYENISLPREIVEFFEKEGGRSLMIKGGAGTGKTTFALQLLEELADPDKSFYLSTRVSDDALYRQFPWLKDKEMRGRIVDSSRVLLDTLYPPEQKDDKSNLQEDDLKKISVARDFLKSISEEKRGPPTKVDKTRLCALIEHTKLPEIERIYQRLEQVLPEKPMLVIDSIEGVTHKYGLEMEEFITTLQKDLVENSNTDVLLVMERPEAGGLEYLVDGVVSFSRSDMDKRRMRDITLEKLRATEIKQPRYLASLQFGRFKAFEKFKADSITPQAWTPKPDTKDFYSTGIEDLDGLLGGGYSKGSYNVIEISDNIAYEEYYAVMRCMLLNFITQDRGMIAIMSGGDHPENLKTDLTRFMPLDKFEKTVRIADYLSTESKEKFIMALGKGTKDTIRKTWMDNELELRGQDRKKPILEYTGFDTLEYLQGNEPALRNLLYGVSRIKVSQDLGIGVLKPGLGLIQSIQNMADSYLKIVDINGCPCIYGVKPKTLLHAIIVDRAKGAPYIKLVPIV